MSGQAKFYESTKTVRSELEKFSKKGKSEHHLDSALFQKFLYGSIGYLTSQSASDDSAKEDQELQLTEWYSVFSQVLPTLFRFRSSWDHRCLTPQNLISYLCNISHKLLSLSQIPPEWHRRIWSAVLHILTLSSQHPSPESEIIGSIALSGFKILRAAGQKAESEYRLAKQTSIHACYELYLLGAAIGSLHPTGKSGNCLKSAKDCLSNFLHLCKSRTSNSAQTEKQSSEFVTQQSATRLVNMAVAVYLLQPEDVAIDAGLALYIEMFRLTTEYDAFCEKLLACGGNLYKYEPSEDTFDFPIDGIRKPTDCNDTPSMGNEKKHGIVQDTVLSVLTFVHELNKAVSRLQGEVILGEEIANSPQRESSKKCALRVSDLLAGPFQDIHSTITQVQTLLKETPGPVSLAVSESLVVLTNSIPRSKTFGSEILVVCVKLLLMSVEVFFRDTIYSAKQNQTELIYQRLNSLAATTSTTMALLDILLPRNDVDTKTVSEIAEMQKSALTRLYSLAEGSKKGALNSELSVHIIKILKKSMSDFGIVSRKLTKLGLFTVTIELVSPLWPVTRMEELLPVISHHQALCESYVKTSQLKKAWEVIGKAAAIDSRLITDTIINVLVTILKQDAKLSVLKLFEPCQDGGRHAQLLVMLARKLVLSQSSQALGHATKILRCLTNHKALSDTEKAVHEFLLAQTIWFEADSSEKASVSSESLLLLKKAIQVLLVDTSQIYDDILVQAAFLYWGLLGTASCQEAMKEQAADIPSGIKLSSPQFPSSVRERRTAWESNPVTPQIVTPKLATTFSSPVPAHPKFKTIMETETVGQVDSQVLMGKASVCLELWSQWFTSVGQQVLEADGAFRAETSLRFLQKLSELAIVNHQTLLALRALCEAHHLAGLMKRNDVVRDIARTVVSLVSQMGLQCDAVKCHAGLGNRDVLMDVLGSEKDANLLNLTAVAEHHLKTGQLDKFVCVRDVTSKVVEDSRKKGLRTCSFYTALAILNRLDAEFHYLHGCDKNMVSGSEAVLKPYPLELAGESLKNITNVVTFHLGENFQSTTNSKSPSFEIWQTVHEYLLSLRLYGNMCLHVGNAKYASTYFTEGLIMANKFLLVTWSAIFSVCLLELALIYNTDTEAQDQLKNIMNTLKKHYQAVIWADSANFTDQMRTAIETDQKVLSESGARSVGFHQSYGSCCTNSASESDAAISFTSSLQRKELIDRLLEGPGTSGSTAAEVEEMGGDGHELEVMCYASACARCFQPEVAHMCASLMCSQAEILWRSKVSLSSVNRCLHAAILSNQKHLWESQREHAENMLKNCGFNICFLPQDVNVDRCATLNALYKLAEVSFQNLYLSDSEKCDSDFQEIEKMLDSVESESRKMKGLGTSSSIVASALLLQAHLSYLPCMGSWLEELKNENIDDGDDEAVIASAVDVAKKEEQYWGQQRYKWLYSLKSTACNIHPGTSPVLNETTKVPDISSTILANEKDMNVILSSNQNRNKTKISKTSGRSKIKSSSIEIYNDFEPAIVKKPRVVLAEKFLQQDTNSSYNTGVDSSCLKYPSPNYVADKAQKSGSGKIKSRKPRKVPESENSERNDLTGMSPLSRVLGLVKFSDNVDRKITGVESVDLNAASKGNRSTLSQSTAHISGSRHQPSSGLDSQNKENYMQSPIQVLQTNKELLSKKKRAQRKEENSKRPNHLKRQDGEGFSSEHRENSNVGQEMIITETFRRSCGPGDMDSAKIVSEDSRDTSGDKRPAVLRNRRCRAKKEGSQDEIMTPVLSRRAVRERRNVTAEPPETVRYDNHEYSLNVSVEDRSYETAATSSSRDFWGSYCETDADENDMGDCQMEINNDSLPYTSLNIQNDRIKPEISSPVMADIFLHNELPQDSKDTNFLSPCELPRGRPLRKKAAAEEPGDGRALKMRRGKRLDENDDNQEPQGGSIKKEEDSIEQSLTEVVQSSHLLGELQTVRLCREKVRDRITQPIASSNKTINPLRGSALAKETCQTHETSSTKTTCRSDIQSKTKLPRARRKEAQDQTLQNVSVVEAVQNKPPRSDDGELKSILSPSIQTFVARFPTLTVCQPTVTRIKHLREALKCLGEFPSSFLYRQMSRSLALCLWEKGMVAECQKKEGCSAQREIAAHLTDSMSVTFQHMMMKNFLYKLGKCDKQPGDGDKIGDWSSLSKEEITTEMKIMRTAMSALQFGGDVMRTFNERLASLPADWTVGQITIVDYDPSNPGRGQIFVSRLTSGSEPVTVGLPLQRWLCLDRAWRVHEAAVQHRVDTVSQEQYWKFRHQQDRNMQNLVHYLQEIFLSGHKWLLRGQLVCVQQPKIQKLLDRAAQETVGTVLELHDHSVSYSTVRSMLEILLEANEKDILSVMECVWPGRVAGAVAQACKEVQRKVKEACGDEWSEERRPLVLILDNVLNKFPWESMPDLSTDTVTRVPSLAALSVMLTLHQKRTRSPFLCGVDRTDVVVVIPPDNDLQNAVSFLAPQFQKYKGWSCRIQKAPTVSELKGFLKDSSLYVYCGHSWGNQYVGGRNVQMFHGKAVAILMGCSSGKLECRRKLDGDGGPLHFILAGCPAVMGNLWLVTDKDIDKLTSHLFSHWMSRTEPVSLGQLLVLARQACRLVGLTGFAPVVYGLPVMMN